MTPDVVCLGILVADVVARPFDELPEKGSLGFVETVSLHGGGCALNTASVLTRLGCAAAVAGKVGADALGDFLLQLLDERGVDRRGVIRDPAAPTSATVVLVGDDGERTFLHSKGANARLEAAELDRELLFSGRCLHVAGALVLDALDGEPMAALLQEAKARGLVTSLDTVWDASGRWERVAPSLPYVDVFAPSLPEEARAFFWADGVPEPAGRFAILLVTTGEGSLAGEPARAGDAFAVPASSEPFDVGGDLRILRFLGPDPS